MEQKKLEGIATFGEDGSFNFDPGLPSAEPVLGFDPKTHRGTMRIEKNGLSLFSPDSKPLALPPLMDLLLRDKNLIVRRTSRNFIVQMKFPIIEAADETTKAHTAMWKRVSASIKEARAQIKNKF